MVPSEFEHRIEVCRRRFAAAPGSRVFAPLADALRLAGRYEEALPLLEEGLVKHPRFAAALVILGHTLLDAGRSAHARRVLETVLGRDAENLVALRLLTDDARSRQDWSAAADFLARLVPLEPDDSRWPAMLAEARDNRKRLDPDDVPVTSFATMTLVEIYMAQGYRAKAMTALRQMQAREPGRADVQAKIEELGQLEGVTGPGGGGRGSGSAPMEQRETLAARRAEEKKSFEDWIQRLRTDESATS